MKTQAVVWLVALLTGISVPALAQKHPAHMQKRETITVPGGPCSTCKKKIESAARGGGASYAKWDMDSGVLTISYDVQYTSSEKIQRRIARAGFDTPVAKANPKAYGQPASCCRYNKRHRGAAPGGL